MTVFTRNHRLSSTSWHVLRWTVSTLWPWTMLALWVALKVILFIHSSNKYLLSTCFLTEGSLCLFCKVRGLTTRQLCCFSSILCFWLTWGSKQLRENSMLIYGEGFWNVVLLIGPSTILLFVFFIRSFGVTLFPLFDSWPGPGLLTTPWDHSNIVLVWFPASSLCSVSICAENSNCPLHSPSSRIPTLQKLLWHFCWAWP